MIQDQFFPVTFENKEYLEVDCDSCFLAFYDCIEALNSEGRVYLSEHIWIGPDGSTIED
jgi:hypothetical protein